MRCRLTCRYLDDNGVDFTVVDLRADAHAAARDYVTEDLGYSEAPVVVVDGSAAVCPF